MNINGFKEEHAAVLSAVAELRSLVKNGISENSDAIAKVIVTMSSGIKLHLAAEDRFLYPTLARSTDPEVALVATNFQQEMGHIAKAYMEFAGKWNIGARVAADPEGFRAEANGIFKALHERIQKENQQLYPLAEAA